MYQVSELAGYRPTPPTVCWAKPRLFFSIYYKVPDNAFKNAANTWKDIVMHQENFLAKESDFFFEREIQSETDFKTAWDELSSKAISGNFQVWAGHLLTHASKQADSNDGLEFQSDVGNDGTLKQSEISKLLKLPWSQYGYLVLAGCNTGLTGTRGWAPAQTFALYQGVPTLGQAGYGYFSTNWSSYKEISSSDTRICLWAFRRGKNGALGNGERISGIIYKF
ncbi:MAG: hypothetical protein U1F42_10650 [Candidatus Competibacteraceae bacterium]